MLSTLGGKDRFGRRFVNMGGDWVVTLAGGQMDEAELWLLGVFESPLCLNEWMCWCLGDQKTGRGLRMHKEAAVWEGKQRQMVRTRVCVSKMIQRPTWTQWHTVLEGTRSFTENLEGSGMPCPFCRVITSAPASPSLERAGEERGSWKDSAFIQRKMHHGRVHFKKEWL